MTDYIKLTDYAAKDALLSGNPSKVVKGTELGAEFDAVAVAVATKLDAAVINAATSKTTPVDADELPITDSAASYALKKLTWANLKATIKAYYDSVTSTLTNKTVNLTSNTLTGTTAQFNTALSDGDFATLAGTETLTNKTVNLTSNTLTGTTAQFNTALSDGDFATLAGTETLTNKTLTSPVLANPSYSGTTANGGTVTTIDINGGTIDGTVIGGASAAAITGTTITASTQFSGPHNGTVGATTPAAGTFTTLTSTGNAALGDAEASDTHAIKGATTLLANSASAALTVTQTGSGNAFVVEDSASTDATPFVIDTNGRVLSGYGTAQSPFAVSSRFQASGVNYDAGYAALCFSADAQSGLLGFSKSRNAAVGSHTIVQSGDDLGTIRFAGSDGASFIQAASITTSVDGTPGTNDMPGRLVFSTTADGASSPTERMRIDSAGNVGIGGTATGVSLLVTKPVTGSTFSDQVYALGEIQSGVTSRSSSFVSSPTVANAVFTLNNWNHFSAYQGTKGASATVNNQYGFFADSTLTGATNNYGFYSNIASGANRYNFYAAGTADNVFMGNMGIGATANAAVRLDVSGTLPSSGNESYSIVGRGTIPSATTTAYGVWSSQATEAASFTVGSLYRFLASQGTIGAGSAITAQYGFAAASSLTGATNNYGFYSNIAAAANRYNFYAAGTADNYFAGIVKTNAATAIPAGGTAGVGVTVSSTANFGVFFGSGAPTLSAAKGSLYLRSDGSTTNDRMYVNTNGSTTWTAVTTAA